MHTYYVATEDRDVLVHNANSGCVGEGTKDYVVKDDDGNAITDIDLVKDGTLWELKSAAGATNINSWVNKHILRKFAAYMRARGRPDLAGYANAPIGFQFDGVPYDKAFQAAVEKAISDLRKANPGVDIRLEWE